MHGQRISRVSLRPDHRSLIINIALGDSLAGLLFATNSASSAGLQHGPSNNLVYPPSCSGPRSNRSGRNSRALSDSTLVTHDGGRYASRCRRDEGGERAATQALLEDIDVHGCVITDSRRAGAYRSACRRDPLGIVQ